MNCKCTRILESRAEAAVTGPTALQKNSHSTRNVLNQNESFRSGRRRGERDDGKKRKARSFVVELRRARRLSGLGQILRFTGTQRDHPTTLNPLQNLATQKLLASISCSNWKSSPAPLEGTTMRQRGYVAGAGRALPGSTSHYKLPRNHTLHLRHFDIANDYLPALRVKVTTPTSSNTCISIVPCSNVILRVIHFNDPAIIQ
ncbi:unnamed protein product [Pieris macdunnoughi]|uniref:Uncharacterized protein n=1 Tax=Pieris macdunnoughi TaxID=345717 RepID=A0A821Y4Z1_9NEOP|nr:unnamed protein product [Pieris macdunnoughi]